MKTVEETKYLYIDYGMVRNFKYYYRRILLFFHDIFYFFIISYFNKRKFKPRETKYYLSICAIFRDEGIFLKEWIEYHLIAGVEHFYLYNNFSDDHYKEVLQPYIDKGIVDLTEWPVPYGQFAAYEDFWKKYKNETKWICFIDIDEFFCPLYETDLKVWLKKYEKYPSILVYWKMFGTSGIIEHDPAKLSLEQYTVCWDKLRTLGKNIANTDWDFEDEHLHHIYTKIRVGRRNIAIPPINVFGKFVKWNIHRLKRDRVSDSCNFALQLNHYWSRAWNIYEGKMGKGNALSEEWFNIRKRQEYFDHHEFRNKAVDYKIFRFLLKLKMAMAE